MTWTDGPIVGVEQQPLTFHTDERGWLVECFRVDELPESNRPLMSYISKTHPDIVRGPHAHRQQSDLFVFFDGTFKVFLWDNRDSSDSYGHRRIIAAGSKNPTSLVIPPGVVHAYKNVGSSDALIINCPNKLYGGWNQEEEIDEIRYEEKSNHPFTLDR